MTDNYCGNNRAKNQSTNQKNGRPDNKQGATDRKNQSNNNCKDCD